ncbi:flagellin [Priestia aryabhattai]|uniref:flagellin N-terminal helical domain-containing protein n=1 Tax=Priestia aryabhattai TaxID=412384 RepID=UPI0023780312|nr:flagellin [Priestia aryabhattai]
MRINHNIAALNTYRQFNNANNAQGKSMEKLSSGLRINKAGDDAAGLAISEKMRGQIRGLDQASANAQDGISLLQTAEGALNETHSILQRMRELGVQSSNDTNTDADRQSINTEINQLKEEVDRIGNTTEFNTKKLIDGSIGAKKVPGTDNAAVISSAVGIETAGSVTTAATSKTTMDTYTGTSATFKIDGADITINHTAADIKAFSAGTSVDSKGLAAKLETDINKSIDAYNSANGKEIQHISVGTSADTNGTLTFKSGSTGGASTISIVAGATGTTNFAEKVLGQTAATVASGTGKEGVYSAGGAGAIKGLKDLAVAGPTKMTFTVDGTDINIDLNATATGAFKAAADATLNGDMTVQATALQTDLNAAITSYNATVPMDKAVSAIKVAVKDGSFVFESGSTKATSSIKFDNSQAAQLLGVAKQNSATQGGGVDFQIGANETQSMKVTVEDMRTDALGIKDIDLSSKTGAEDAITKINDAIEKVSTQRSNLGAFQNRLEHTINNLSTSSENLTSAESRIRDVDYVLAA